MKEINENQLGEIVGGGVNLSESRNKIGFTTLGEGYELKCKFQDAYKLLLNLQAQYMDLSEAAFDKKVKEEFQAKGYI